MSDGMTEAFARTEARCRECYRALDADNTCSVCSRLDKMLAKGDEFDPNGIDQHEPGAKLDAGKIRADLVLGEFSRALMAVSEVGTKGAIKYTPKGWLEVPNGEERYGDAGMRHYLKRKSGEEIDPDTGLLHLAHECWNKLAELELKLRSK